jgi:hypothetical protein
MGAAGVIAVGDGARAPRARKVTPLGVGAAALGTIAIGAITALGAIAIGAIAALGASSGGTGAANGETDGARAGPTAICAGAAGEEEEGDACRIAPDLFDDDIATTPAPVATAHATATPAATFTHAAVATAARVGAAAALPVVVTTAAEAITVPAPSTRRASMLPRTRSVSAAVGSSAQRVASMRARALGPSSLIAGSFACPPLPGDA